MIKNCDIKIGYRIQFNDPYYPTDPRHGHCATVVSIHSDYDHILFSVEWDVENTSFTTGRYNVSEYWTPIP